MRWRSCVGVSDTEAGGGAGEGEVGAEGQAGFDEAGPVGRVGQRGDCDRLAHVEPGEGGVDHFLDIHQAVGRQGGDVDAGLAPEFGAGGAGQDRLDADGGAGQFGLQGGAEVQQEGLAAAVGGVEPLGRQREYGGDVDQGALAAGDEAGDGGVGEAEGRGNVEVHHGLELVGVGAQQRAGDGDAGVVDQHGDGGVVAQALFDAQQVGPGGQVGGQDVDRAAGFGAEVFGQGAEAGGVARDEDEVVAAAGQAVGIDGADAGGGAGDEGRVGKGHGRTPPVGSLFT